VHIEFSLLLFSMVDELSSLWANLSLAEEEDGELEIQKTEVKGAINRGQLCIIGQLLSERIVSKETIKDSLLGWWRIKGFSTFKILGGNLFLIEFEKASDKVRVLEGRPWVFEGNLFLVEDFDGRTSPSEFTFDRASFWVRMMNLPLACMGRGVGLKLGAFVGQVEEVDTEKDGVGWGEFLRVKINIDLYKPLSRGRMIKFDGKSTLIGFKYEHLLKFCFHCGVICHGVEGCLKRTKMRNQEVNQYGLWLRASSPTRRAVKAYDRHAENYGSSRYAKPVPEEGPKQSGVQGKKEKTGRKRRAAEYGERSFAGDNSRDNHNVLAKETGSGKKGRNRGEDNDEILFESQTKKERNNVGALRGQFEKFSTPYKEAWIPCNEGKNRAGVSAGAHAGKVSKNFSSLSPRKSGHAGHIIESPPQQRQNVTLHAGKVSKNISKLSPRESVHACRKFN
jgi:hypothetical protein